MGAAVVSYDLALFRICRAAGFMRVAAIFLALFFLVLPTDVAAYKRVALIVANADYKNATPLVNPLNDATLISERLKQFGFVIHRHNNVANANELLAILHRFTDQLDSETVALFYYAGHGMQYRGENLLIGVAARLSGVESLQAETFSLSRIAGLIEPRADTTLLFWDACRNNPLADLVKTGIGPASVDYRIGNTFVVLSAAPGQEAIDGGQYSPFAEALATRIATPDLDIEPMVKMVAGDVVRSTNNRQRPDRSSQLSRFFYFNPQSEESRKYEADAIKLAPTIREAERPPSRPAPFKIGPRIRPMAFGEIGPQPLLTRSIEPPLTINNPMATIIRRIRISPDGKLLALGGDDGYIRLVSLETFSVTHAVHAHNGRISDLDFSADGRLLLSSGRDGTARLWRIDTNMRQLGELMRTTNASLMSGRLNPYFPDKFALFGDDKGHVYAKDLKRDKLITDKKFHVGSVEVAYQPNGKGTYFSAGADGTLNVRLPEGRRVPIKAHEGRIFEADYASTGAVAYTVGYDRKIKIWDTRNGFFTKTPLRVIEGHLKYVLAASMSRTDNVLVSGGGDKAVNVWSADSGKLIARLVGHRNDIEAVAITPDNRFVISTSEDKSMRIWSVENRQELLSMYFRTGTQYYSGVTFDQQLFGDKEAGLIMLRVDGKEVSLDEKHLDRYIGREIYISEQ
jgi:hypothetical protein